MSRHSIMMKALIPIIAAGNMAGATAISQPLANASTAPAQDKALRQAYSATDLGNGQVLPPVVAIVGSTEISSQQFARRVAVTRHNNQQRKLGMTEQQTQEAALQSLIRQAALHERAKSEGITVSDAEVRSFIEDQARQRDAILAVNPEGLAAFNAFLAAQNLPNAAAYDNDPRTFTAAQLGLAAAKLVTAYVGATATPDQREAFIQDTIARASVNVYLDSR